MSRALRTYTLLAAFTLPACHASNPPPSAEAPAGLEEAVRANLDPGPEYHQVGEILRGVAPKEDVLLHWPVTLEHGRCYVFSAVGDQTVDELKIFIFNPNDVRVFSRRRPGKNHVIGQFCVDGELGIPGIYRIELKPTQGYGHVRVGVFMVPPSVLLSRPR